MASHNAPSFTSSSITHYFVSRIPTLRPPSFQQKKHLLNPFPVLGKLSAKQWHFVAVAFLGWAWDAFDFFTVALVAPDIADTFGKNISDISWGITLVLMFRWVGAIIFGLAGDKYGRKWPFIVNLVLFIVLELATGFAQNYTQFLVIRAIYGIAVGALYGNAAATALEDCPVEARGFISGLLQQGYAFGYLLCVVFTRAIADTSPHGWRALFWFGAAPPVLIIIYRVCLPETECFLAQRDLERESVGKSFVEQGKSALKAYWLTVLYMILLVAGMGLMSHGSQDLYPIFLNTQLGFSANASTVTNCVANLGAFSGGIIWGHTSEFLGRRLSIMLCCILGGALIYPWVFVRDNAGINAGVFFLQFAVQGAWGVMPIHMSELSHPRFRSFIVGTSYQVANLATCASTTIETTIGEKFPLLDSDGNKIPGKYNYGKVMAIFMGCVFGYVLLAVFLGPENRDANLFTLETDEEFAESMNIPEKSDCHVYIQRMDTIEEEALDNDASTRV
jgi:SHS family lactate transporter-like MFS transporter